MAKVQRVKFNANYYDSGKVKYAQGEHYPKTAQTDSCVLAGHAEYLDVDMPREDAAAEQKAAEEKLAAEREPTTKAEAAAARGGDAIPDDSWSDDQLRAYLDGKNISYSARAKHEDLLALASAAT